MLARQSLPLCSFKLARRIWIVLFIVWAGIRPVPAQPGTNPNSVSPTASAGEVISRRVSLVETPVYRISGEGLLIKREQAELPEAKRAPRRVTSKSRVIQRSSETERLFDANDRRSDGIIVLTPEAGDAAPKTGDDETRDEISPLATGYRSWTYTGPTAIPNYTSWRVLPFPAPTGVPAGAVVSSVVVHHEITHPWIGDLVVYLDNASHSWLVRNQEGGSADNINETRTELTLFDGDNPVQNWEYWITDIDPADNGTLDFVQLWVYYDYTPTPDLTPYQLPAWNDKIPVGITQLAGTATHSYTGPYTNTQPLYVNWACLNQGTATASNYTVRLEVTGTGGGVWEWTGLSTDPSYFLSLINDTAVGPLSAGSHTFKMWVDYTGVVGESDETNNYYERTITVEAAPPDLTPYQPVAWNDKIPVGIAQLAGTAEHSYTGPYGDNQSLYVNWACLNQGGSTASSYTVRLEVTGTGGGVWDSTGLATDPGYYMYYVNDVPVGPLSAGSHTFKMWVDYTGAVGESNETNNYYERTITVAAVPPEIRIEPTTVDFSSVESLAGSPTSPRNDIASDLNAILLKRRPFVPKTVAGLGASEVSRHAIIQFQGQPEEKTLKALAGQGVKILQYVPRNAVMAYVPASATLASVPGIRWIGALEPTDKLSAHLGVSLNKGFVLVDVFPDVTGEQAKGIIADAGGEIVENPYLLGFTHLVRADMDVVTKLSNTDEVSWIWAASDAIVQGLAVHRCPGPLTGFGPVGDFVAHDEGWDGPGLGSANLTYHFMNGTPDIAGDLEEAEVVRGIGEWSRYAQIGWTETASPGLSQSMDILWGAGDHGDGYPFDGPGGVLAHCFYPAPPNPETIAGDMHFDEDETWRIGSDFDVFSVALHESGHGLGLAHSDDPNAVMYAYYQVVSHLHQDDIDGIRSLYAATDNTFTIYNDGAGTLNVTSIEKRDGDAWLTSWVPAAPFTVAPGDSQVVALYVDPNLAAFGLNEERLLVYSNDSDESPYPSAVFVNLTRTDADAPTPGTASSPAYDNASPIPVTYAGAGDAGSGLKHVELWYKKGAGGTWTDSGLTQTGSSGSFDFAGMSGDDTYFFDLVAVDNADNRSAAASGSGDDSTIYDTTAPTVTVDALETNDPTPDLTGTVNDASAAIDVTVNGHTYPATNHGATWSANVADVLAAGTYDVAVQATDPAGNVGNDASSDELTVVYPVVNVTGDVRYPSLQGAVDAADPDDEIQAEAWTYDENVTIGKPLALSSVSGTTTTIVNGGVRLTTDSCIVEGFRIVGGHDFGNGSAAIQIDGTSGHMIANNRIEGPGASGTGVLLTSGTRESDVSDNEISGWACGVSITSSTILLVDGNSIHGNTVGLASNGLRDSLILSNRFESNTQAGWGCSNAQGYLAGRLNGFVSNALGVRWDGGAVVDARNNWWGDATGPSGGVNDPVTGAPANGSGDPVGANVRFSSWLAGPTPSIAVTNPSGGSVTKGEDVEIRWTSTDLDENVKIWLEMDGAYYLVANNVADSGSYVWTVNRGPSSSYARVWVMPMTTERVSGASADFAISAPSSVVTSPAAGVTWTRGQPGTIQWNTAFFGSAHVKIWLEMDAGYYLVANDIENTGSYSWTVGRGPSTSYARIWVISMATEAVRAASGDFTILPAPALTQPNASSVWGVGETRSIEWPQASFSSRVKIWLEMDGGYYPVAKDVENVGSYSWNVSRGPSSAYAKIWVIDMNDESKRLASANFQIVQGASITVNTPDTGSNPWRVGDTESITWTWTGSPGNVKIWLEMDGSYYLIVNDVANTGSYSWKINRGPSNSYARITAISMASEKIRGTCGVFQISPSAP